MLQFNWIAILSASIIPLVVGFIYYNPKVMGKAWMAVTGITEEQGKEANMLKIFGLTLLLGILLAFFLMPVVLHVIHVFSLVAPKPGEQPDPNSPSMKAAMDFIANYGGGYRTFKHGAFHGILAALLGIWPVLGINALFERRGWKYTAIHLGYWVITLALMGGVVCAFGIK